jgi:hypothetical protein
MHQKSINQSTNLQCSARRTRNIFTVEDHVHSKVVTTECVGGIRSKEESVEYVWRINTKVNVWDEPIQKWCLLNMWDRSIQKWWPLYAERNNSKVMCTNQIRIHLALRRQKSYLCQI